MITISGQSMLQVASTQSPSQKPSSCLGSVSSMSALTECLLFHNYHDIVNLACPLVGEARSGPTQPRRAPTSACGCAVALVAAILILGPSACWIRCSCLTASLQSHHSSHCFWSIRLFPHTFWSIRLFPHRFLGGSNRIGCETAKTAEN